MNSLSQLESMGIGLPSPAYLLGLLLFGVYGFVAYRRGKTAANSQLRWTGLALMLYPYAVPQTWLLWLVGVALCGWAYRQWE